MSENNLNSPNAILLKTSFGDEQVFNVFKAAAIIIFQLRTLYTQESMEHP